jgi:membrane protein DedA with SNARE-associated domain
LFISEGGKARLILRGLEVLTAAKFLPFGILVPLRAGAIEIGPWRFVLVDAVCSLFYASVYVLPGFIFHGQLEQFVKGVRRFGAFTFVLLLLLVGGYVSSSVVKRIRFKKGHAQKFSK